MPYSVITATNGDVLNIGFEQQVPKVTYEMFDELSQASTWVVEKRPNRESEEDVEIDDSYYLQKWYPEKQEKGDILNKSVTSKTDVFQLNSLAEAIFALQEQQMITVMQAAYDKGQAMFLLDIPSDVVDTSSRITSDSDVVKEYIAISLSYKQPTATGVMTTDMRLICANMINAVAAAAHKSNSFSTFMSADKDSVFSLLKDKQAEREKRARYYQMLAGYEIQPSQAEGFFRQIMNLPMIGDVNDMEVKDQIKDRFDSLMYTYNNGEHIQSLGNKHTAYRVLNAVTEGSKDAAWGAKATSMFTSQFAGASKSARNKLHRCFSSMIPMENVK